MVDLDRRKRAVQSGATRAEAETIFSCRCVARWSWGQQYAAHQVAGWSAPIVICAQIAVALSGSSRLAFVSFLIPSSVSIS